MGSSQPAASEREAALEACAKIGCIRMFWLAERPCDEYTDGRELCGPCMARVALAAHPTPPPPLDWWDDLLREFPTKRDATIRGILEKHRARLSPAATPSPDAGEPPEPTPETVARALSEARLAQSSYTDVANWLREAAAFETAVRHHGFVLRVLESSESGT